MELDSRHTSRHTRLWMKSQILMFHWDSRLFWFYQINSSRVSAGGNSSFHMKPGNTNPIPGPFFCCCSAVEIVGDIISPLNTCTTVIIFQQSINYVELKIKSIIWDPIGCVSLGILKSQDHPHFRNLFCTLYKQETMKCQP